MAVKRNQRVLPLAFKSAAAYPLNASLAAAYDYADGNGAPHLGTLTLGHNGSPTIVSLNSGEIQARDPSQGKTVVTPYNGLTTGKLGIGAADGKGNWTIHRRYRAPSAYSGTSANRNIAQYRDAAGNILSIVMVESIANPWCYFFTEIGGSGATSVPPAGTRDSTAAFRIPYGSIVDLHIIRSGDVIKFSLNGVQIGSLTTTTYVLYNTNWTGLATNDGIDAGNPNDLLLIDATYWGRDLSTAEVTQHQADPYFGYTNTATAATVPAAPTSPTITAGQGSITVNATPGSDGGAAISGYTVNAYKASDNTLVGTKSAATLPITITGLASQGTYAKVLATNIVGPGPESVASATVTPAPPPSKPAAPTAPVATAGVKSVSVTGTPGSDGGSAVTGYTANVYSAATNALLGTASAATLPVVVGNLSYQPVYAKLIATNVAGDSPESVASATVAPTDPAYTPVRFDFPATYRLAQQVIVLPPEIVSVTVLPGEVTMQGGDTQQFSVNVQGLNNPDFGVTWSAQAGTVDQQGLFVAPAGTPQEQRFAVRATSKQDVDKWGEAQVFIPARIVTVTGVTVTPSVAQVQGGESVQFAALVEGANSPSQEVTWATSLGTISASGVVQAPAATIVQQIGTVTATSALVPSKKGAATFVVAAGLAASFTPSVSRQVRILPGRLAFAVGSHWTLGSAGPVGSKDPNSAIDIPFDWSEWLADIGDPALAKIEFLLGGGLTSEGVVPNAKGGTIVVSGGSLKDSGTVTCRITTNTTPPRVEDRTVVLQMKEQ